jgi:sugar O-acyltransferase (sialic acid O-acetyltransferase NeuD family)
MACHPRDRSLRSPKPALIEHCVLSSSLRRIIIVGAGGLGREVLNWARDAWPEHSSKIAGFLSADNDRLNGHARSLPIVSDPDCFEPQSGDGLLLAIGIPETRRRVAESLLAKNAVFLTLIHPTAIIAPTASIGLGSLVCPHVIVSDCASVGRFVLLNYHASLGHDSSAGDFAVLSPHATLGGNARVEADVFMGMHASIAPGKIVGPRSKVSANSSALHDTEADSIVFGVPGRIAPLVR